MLSIFTKKPKVVVHSGKFHPDDITAVAILSLYLDKPVKIFRSRDPQIWAKADYLLDVGDEYKPEGNKFDHHQSSFTLKRENGMPYSSAGLAWKHFGEKVAGSHEIWKKIDEKVIQPIDADDYGIELVKNNFPGISPYGFLDYLYTFNPTWLEKDVDTLKAFTQAVEEAKKMLQREIKRMKDSALSVKYVEEIYRKTEDKRIIIFDTDYSWKNTLIRYPEPIFVVGPRADTHTWGVATVKENELEFKSRLAFPESWAGKRDEDLAKVTGVPDALFCNKLRFLAGARSKEGAIALAKLALNQNKQ